MARLLKIAGDPIMGDVPFQFRSGEAEILFAGVLDYAEGRKDAKWGIILKYLEFGWGDFHRDNGLG